MAIEKRNIFLENTDRSILFCKSEKVKSTYSKETPI